MKYLVIDRIDIELWIAIAQLSLRSLAFNMTSASYALYFSRRPCNVGNE